MIYLLYDRLNLFSKEKKRSERGFYPKKFYLGGGKCFSSSGTGIANQIITSFFLFGWVVEFWVGFSSLVLLLFLIREEGRVNNENMMLTCSKTGLNYFEPHSYFIFICSSKETSSRFRSLDYRTIEQVFFFLHICYFFFLVTKTHNKM